MANHKRGIRKRDARVLLSDVLPYELPPSFSNRGLYDFINKSKLRIAGSEIRARMLDAGTAAVLSILLGRFVVFPLGTNIGEEAALEIGKKPLLVTKPFQFSVRHKANDYRTLTVPHPAAQLEIVDFYRRNADLMLYHTARSEYSLRRPFRVARYSVFRDWLFEQNKSSSNSIELESREYEWLRSYFTYKRYSNVYKFYDSAEYRACERKYGYLVKADVAKCFDSIYTHTVAWAIHGHDLVKENLQNIKGTFGDEFDGLMQRLNHNETSGITIGSEVSRIFAEIILQAVDRDIFDHLSAAGLVHGVDYEILRYVDDYFVFLADSQKRLSVLEQIARSLRTYKLHPNSSKEEGEHTPWLSPLTVAKERTARLIRKSTKLGIRDSEPDPKLPSPYVRAERLIVGYKSILIDTAVSHFDLANFALSRSERATEKLIQSSRSSIEKRSDETVASRAAHVHSTIGALIALLDFVFFAYSGAPRMSPAVKVARIVSTCIRYSRLSFIGDGERERIERRLKDELLTQLVRARRSESPSAVTATLLDCISDLGPHYRLSESELLQVFGFDLDTRGTVNPPLNMNVLIYFSLLMHIRNDSGYVDLRAACEKWAAEVGERPATDGERAILDLNLLTCPYVSLNEKSQLLGRHGMTDPMAMAAETSTVSNWNVDWRNFDLYSALQQKRLYEVY